MAEGEEMEICKWKGKKRMPKGVSKGMPKENAQRECPEGMPEGDAGRECN